MFTPWRNPSPFPHSSPLQSWGPPPPSLLTLPVSSEHYLIAFPEVSLSEVLVSSDGLGGGGGEEVKCTKWGGKSPPPSSLNPFSAVLGCPGFTLLFCCVSSRGGVGEGIGEGLCIQATDLLLAQRSQLRTSGLACAAGLASFLGQGAERPRVGSSEKS